MNHKDRSNDQNSLLNCRVLIAEDSIDNQRIISHYLEKESAAVITADNGEIAVELALKARENNIPFHVILMDIEMPVLDGYKATKKLRQADYTGRIIAHTAHTDTHSRKKCLDAGCDDYISKPINQQSLVSKIARYAMQEKQNELFDQIFKD
ncbi:Transcriptional regulatory protein SrrA [Gimesia aquarii]|uniref:Transcriptional regulatory protein SrrA n=2 Tax=Gimesia aquarii TaxID=2527964 RepID=A0A517X036_9PLAN|nr:Transcriptional regulatory protein SrrA [Gimesia aquarii]